MSTQPKSKPLFNDLSHLVEVQPEWINREIRSLTELKKISGAEVSVDASYVHIVKARNIDRELLVISEKAPCLESVGIIVPLGRVFVRYENGFVVSMHLNQKFNRYQVHEAQIMFNDKDLVIINHNVDNPFYGVSRVEFEE